MLKLFVIAAVISLGCRWMLGDWPWAYLQAKPTRGRAVLDARKLLGVRHGASRGEIVDAHRRRVAAVHPDRGGTNDQVHEANAARDLLLDDLSE
ncbi:J domain-containing protein [Tsuneonella amylolytica]|uniref:J domain-containing protein n=1 Tax=Tsuneonella amylolytica TaxID=2338327 RepID=UPI000EA9EBEB|nr:J domain-containing protein [Tsuneonella amylolytica]